MRRVSLILIFLAACAPGPSNPPAVPAELHPYSTVTPSATSPLPEGVIVSAPAPIPTVTPSLYTVKSGDTLSQIAERFRITLDALLAENPDIDPNAMSVGQTLKIPGSPADRLGDWTPTPVPFPIDQIACHRTVISSAWCFILIRNDSSDTLEDITAQVTLIDSAGTAVDSRVALLPLDIVRPGASMPLSVYFPPQVPHDVQPQVQILTAIRLLPDDARYLSAEIRNTAVEVSWSGFSARVSGQAVLPAGSAPAGTVWVAAVAYDPAGNVVGWRRWESTANLAGGGTVPFEFVISSVAGPIDRVDFAVEARP